MDNNNNGFLAGLIIGGLVGAGIALLNAPQTGEETRQQISNRAQQELDRAQQESQRIIDQARTQADSLISQAQSTLDTTREKLNQPSA